MSTPDISFDDSRAEAFGERLFEHYTGGMVTYMIDLGHRTGLFDAAVAGPATSAELAQRAGLQERYVREWLGALVTAGIFEYDAATGRCALPAEHAACLTGEGNDNVARFSQLNTHLAGHLNQVAAAFRDGGGVPYSAFRPEFTDVMDVVSRNTFEDLLLDGFLPLAPGLTQRLQDGARVADLGCGTGHAVVLLAKSFPASSFIGFDLAPDAIERARAQAAASGLDNVRFEVRDVTEVGILGPYDVVMTFDTVHDLADPAGTLRAAREALVPGGIFLMAEPTLSSRLEENIDSPIAPWIYGLSTLHCLPVSLAENGAGLGTAFGEQRALELLDGAGFEDIQAHSVEGEPIDKVYIGRRVGSDIP